MAYLSIEQFKDRSTLPSDFIDALELVRAGWLAAQLELGSSWINARLSKRYAVPFASPVPEIVLDWLARIVTFSCWRKRGYDPADDAIEAAQKDADDARAEVKEAADSAVGLFDLPLRQNTTETGIARGGPYVYSEASPYVWTDVQVATADVEDSNGRGSGS